MNDAVERIANSWEFILPEIVLVATACVHFLAGPFLVTEAGQAPAGLRHRWGGLALAGLIGAAFFWFRARPMGDVAPLGPFRLDDLTWFVRGLAIAGGAVLLLTAWNRVDDGRAAEHHACLLLITAGASLVGAANDLIVLFLALELVSIPTYVMLYLGRRGEGAQEATLKYFLLSVFSSALVLFGFAYLYGVTGTTNLTGMYSALTSGAAAPPVLAISAAAVIAGLGFRVTAVPFHFYAPDVFQGASTGGAAMLSFVPKIVGFAALLRVLTVPSYGAGPETLAETAEPIFWGLAVLSMCVGNVLAFLQTDVRRLMAYSSIAHAGYMLVGLAVAPYQSATVAGIPALLFYLVAYGAMTVGVFAILAAVRPADADPDHVTTTDDLAGLNVTHPLAALLMTVFLFSLTGLPPTAGFLGKLQLFFAAWSADTGSTRCLAVVMAANAAVSAWYYLRLIGVMYLQAPKAGRVRPLESPAFLGGLICAAATIALFVAPDWLWQTVVRIGG